MVPYHCLGSIWSQRDKKGKEHLAPTIRATVTQFNNVANCVITTCLGDRSMKASDRARVVEHWVEVARVCCGGSPRTPLTFACSQWCVVCGLSPCTDPRLLLPKTMLASSLHSLPQGSGMPPSQEVAQGSRQEPAGAPAVAHRVLVPRSAES